ncbi:MAG: hypothetical protein M3490_01225 [Chloroflexota bacterium]|nr:hypothetical protein [Chloroflexota bacterium]
MVTVSASSVSIAKPGSESPSSFSSAAVNADVVVAVYELLLELLDDEELCWLDDDAEVGSTGSATRVSRAETRISRSFWRWAALATCSATRVLPTPPGPVRVRRDVSGCASSAITSATSLLVQSAAFAALGGEAGERWAIR